MWEIYEKIHKLYLAQSKQCQKKNWIIYAENKCFCWNFQNSEEAEIEGILVIKQGPSTEFSLWYWIHKPNRLKMKETQTQHPEIDTFVSCNRGLFCLSLLLALRKKNSIQFSHSVMSDSLQPYGLQHSRLPCPSPTPRAYSNSCPSSQWYHPTISSSVIPFSSCLQSFPASGSFLVSQFFTSGGQSIGVSASASVLPMNTQDWFPLGLIGWISLESKGLSRVFSNTTVQKHQFFCAQPSLWSNCHTHIWLLEKP